MADLRDQVPFDRNGLDDAIQEQAGLFLLAADEYALAVSRRDAAKTEMDTEFAKACDRARRGEGKITEAAVKEAAQLDGKYLASEKAYREAKLEVDQADNIKGAFEMRGKMLREMTQLYIAGYYQDAGIRGRKGVGDDAAKRARDILHTARKSRT